VDSVSVRVIARRRTRSSASVIRIRGETTSIEVRASEVASPRQADQLISSSSVARPSSSRASPNGAIPTGWCGPRCTAGVSALVDLDGQGP
jgi:hypothetical protein